MRHLPKTPIAISVYLIRHSTLTTRYLIPQTGKKTLPTLPTLPHQHVNQKTFPTRAAQAVVPKIGMIIFSYLRGSLIMPTT